MSAYVDIRDLKEGDKFYWLDGLIYVLYQSDISPTNIEMVLRKFKTYEFIKITILTTSTPYTVFRYRRRDKGSFNAGFKLAVQQCTKHMDSQQQREAGVDNTAMTHLTMNSLYNVWKNNK